VGALRWLKRWLLGHEPIDPMVQLGVDIENGMRPVDDVLAVPEVARVLPKPGLRIARR
jgi:hypothetical protein